MLTGLFILSMLFFKGLQQRNPENKFDNVKVDQKSFKYAKDLHINWYLHALKALFGQMGKQLTRKLPYKEQLLLATCLDEITDDFDLVAGARCLIKARIKLREKNKQSPLAKNSRSFQKNPENSGNVQRSVYFRKYRKYFKKRKFRNEHLNLKMDNMSKISTAGSYCHNVQRNNFCIDKILAANSEAVNKLNGSYRILKLQLVENDKIYSSFFESAKKYRKFHKPILKDKNNLTLFAPSLGSASRRKRSPYRLMTSHTFKSDSIIVDIKQMRNQPALNDPKLSPIQKVTKLIRILYQGTEQSENWITTYNRILKFKKKVDESIKSSGTKAYRFRLYDLVFDNDHPTKRKLNHGKAKKNDLFTIAYDFVKTNVRRNHAENLNLKLLSPRLMPVMPDKMKSKERFLSPSIFAFYNDDSADNIAALPKILEKTELSEKDRAAILEMIMEVSGAKQAVELAMKLFDNKELYGLESEFFEATQRLANVFTDLEKTFNKQQRKDLDDKGYTFLEVKQYKMVLHAHGVNDTKDVRVNLDEYQNLDRRKREDALWDCIDAIAQNDSSVRKRVKREAISVISPVVLSPYMFSPVMGFSVVGPVVLSPNIFSPLVFNPSVVGPFVMSPAIAMPFVISPYILSPYVMSPIIMAPFVLNPYILSPNVMNPYVLSPVVLSPFVFCPDVLSPQTLGGAYLSPNVFSPAIGTESFLMASILSPSWMS